MNTAERDIVLEGNRYFTESGLWHGPGACTEECRSWFVTADYLYLQPRRSALDFAIVDPNQNDFPEGPVESLEWGYDSGFRLRLVSRAPDHWQFGATWSHLTSDSQRILTAPAGGKLWTTMTHPEVVEGAETALGLLDLDYDVLDIELGRRAVGNEVFALHLLGGVRLAWIDQMVSVLYDTQTPNAIVDANMARVLRRSDFNGVGLRVGGEGRRRLWGSLYLFGHSSTSLMIGYSETLLMDTNDNGATVVANIRESFSHVVPVIDLGLGLGWQCGRWQFRAGYELTHWINLVNERDFIDDVNEGKTIRRLDDLSLDGLLLQLGVGW